MHLLLFLSLATTLVLTAGVPQTHGVHPSLVSRYTPKGTTWTCLDGSKTIPWTAVNDDYCDCLDGSDEPGTSACLDNTFYCLNEEHIGASISSSRVNDGLCEPTCCDGSDEPAGVCENTCAAAGKLYRQKQEAVRKLQSTGSKIRSTYIAFARKEKERLEGEIESCQKETVRREQEVARVKDLVDRTEALSAEVLEHKKKSPLYASLITHHNALKSLQREYKKHLEREKQFSDILDTLIHGYNPNYQDMAVLEAVRGWEYLAGPPHGEAEPEEGSDEEEEATANIDEVEEEPDDSELSAEQLEQQLDELLRVDHVSLLMEHDSYVDEQVSVSPLHDIKAYLPDFLIPQYDVLRDTLLSGLQILGIVKGTSSAASEATKAREKLNDAERSFNLAQRDLEQVRKELSDLFDPTRYGAQGEWKKLQNLCLKKDTGGYEYEVCLFEGARQQSQHGGSHSLGQFASWNPSLDVVEGSKEYYSTQVYSHGTRCWNGPERSVKLDLTCGTENALLTVTELEKCEYLFTGTTPALCLPPDGKPEFRKDEL